MAIGRWPAILVIYAIGLLASAQLGKFAALVPVIQPDLGLGLTAAAALVSLIETGGAAIGLFAGAAVGRHGTRAVLATGLGLLAVAGCGEALAGSVPALFGWRLVESLGYLAIVVAAPTLMALTATPRQRGLAMALWSTFFPVGFAAGSVLAGLMAPALSWRPVLFASAGLSLAALAAVWFLPRPAEDGQRGRALAAGLPPLPVWRLSLGFGCYTVFAVGQIALLPSYLAGPLGLAPGAAGLVTGLASFATVAGGLAAARMLRHRDALPAILALCMALPAMMLFGVFGLLPGAVGVGLLAIALNVVTGIVPAVVFARLPDLSPTAAAMARGNGLLAQFGAAGSLIGPPAYAAAVGWSGWTGAAVTGAAMSAISFCLLLGAFRPAQAGRMTAGSTGSA